MRLKKKSVIVAFVSGLVVSIVLILTLVGYSVYLEIKNEESRISYEYALAKISARIYGKYVEISGLKVMIEKSGALRDKVLLEGTVKNNGEREISEIIAKIKFLDKDGAVIYEAVSDLLEPALGAGTIGAIKIPYLSYHPRVTVKIGGSLPFKKILANPPAEIYSCLRDEGGFSRNNVRWSEKFDYEIISVKLADSE
jgi:hypothetical protein